jgi:predicted O-methyltransferase YrrM
MAKAEDATQFVEVGCKEGRTTAHLLEHCPELHVTAIDPWCEFPGQHGIEGGETYTNWDFGQIETEFWARTEPWSERLTFHRSTSEDAAIKVGDNSQDLIFIDAAHDYDSVIQDIHLWAPKVKENGILAGHDFQHKFPSVMRAVADSFNLMRVQTAPDSIWWIRL